MNAANGPDSSTLGQVLWNWLSNSTASTSDDAATQIKCYAFPYGALGFVAHLAMFYGILLSSFNRCPYNYRKPLKHPGRDLVFGIVGFVLSCFLLVGSINRCSGTKYYVLIAVSKILTTVASSAMGIHIAWNLRGRGNLDDDDDDESQLQLKHYNTLWWLTLEVIGSILEFIGGIMLQKESHGAITRTPIIIINIFLAGCICISIGIIITWLEVRQHGQRRVEWEVRKSKERLQSRQPRARSSSRRRATLNGEGQAEALPNPIRREGSRRRSGRHDAEQGDGRGSPSPVAGGQDIEAQGLIAPAERDESEKGPALYHYRDVANSAKRLILVVGATFGLFVTLYTDFILGAISGSYWGYPEATGNLGIAFVYVVIYFVVRLMPVLSA